MDKECILKEIEFKAVRSSGAGGQHVNKVSSKVTGSINLTQSLAFDEEARQTLLHKLASKLTHEGVLVMSCEDTRSQHKNKEILCKKIITTLTEALKKPKKRKPTKPSAAVLKKRVVSKQIQSEKKALRKKPPLG